MIPANFAVLYLCMSVLHCGDTQRSQDFELHWVSKQINSNFRDLKELRFNSNVRTGRALLRSFVWIEVQFLIFVGTNIWQLNCLMPAATSWPPSGKRHRKDIKIWTLVLQSDDFHLPAPGLQWLEHWHTQEWPGELASWILQFLAVRLKAERPFWVTLQCCSQRHCCCLCWRTHNRLPLRKLPRASSTRVLDAAKAQSTQDATQANGTCWCKWGCPHCTQTTSKLKHSNLRQRRVPRPVLIGPSVLAFLSRSRNDLCCLQDSQWKI